MNEQRYGLNTAPFGTHALVAEEIGENNTVLDVGCNKGYLKELAHKSNMFYGLDANEKAVAEARKRGYSQVDVLDLNDCQHLDFEHHFDVLLFIDVLEHLFAPDQVLPFFLERFAVPGVKVIVSLPNVAHLSIRLSLLFGRFEYTEAGILDRTHFRFYTLKTARKFLQDAGLEIKKEKFSSNRFGALIKKYPFIAPVLAFNLIFICEHKLGPDTLAH